MLARSNWLATAMLLQWGMYCKCGMGQAAAVHLPEWRLVVNYKKKTIVLAHYIFIIGSKEAMEREMAEKLLEGK